MLMLHIYFDISTVLRLMGTRDMSWTSMKSFLSKRGVKEEIRTFDARKTQTDYRDAVEKLIESRPESFDQKSAKRASAAAAPLAEWVLANVKFSKVLEKIEPLEKQQFLLQRNLKLAEDEIGKLSSELMDVDQRVQVLKTRLNQYTKEAAEIEFHLTKAKDTLLAAEGLVEKLLDEFSRWSQELQELDKDLNELSDNALIAAAFITYLSDAPEDLRMSYVKQWCSQLDRQLFDFCKFMTEEKDLLQWQNAGLPSDKLSQENAIIITRFALRPYLIDPSCRATEWLKTTLSSNQRQVTTISLHDPKLPHELELAVRFGKTLIVYEADSVEPILLPVLRGDLYSQGSRELLQVGNKTVDYNKDFRLYLSTRSPNPDIPPDAAAVVTVVNFTTTRSGLSSQLLSATLSFEKPELETKKNNLLKSTEGFKMQLEALSASLLKELAQAQGNILENKELLESLNKTKANSLAISSSLIESSKLEEALNKEIDIYLPLVKFGSRIYFAVIDAAKLNPIYQFSLASFLNLYKRILRETRKSASTAERINNLKQELEIVVYEYVCRTLFKDDRLSFGLHLSHAMHSDLFQENEWEAFTGQLVTDLKGDSYETAKSSLPSWISEDRRFPVYLLKSTFPILYSTLNLTSESLWNDFYQSSECEEKLPKGIQDNLSSFQKLMLIQTLRPDRLLSAMSEFVRSALNRKSLFPPPINLRSIAKDSIASEPILIVISSGADPSQELRDVAHDVIKAENYVEISMGQGQAEIAIKSIKEASQNGQWVCLKNLHLVTHWLPILEKEIQSLSSNVHDKFRLWLTSEPHSKFPELLAKSCLKVAYEAPQGLKKNLQCTYENWTREYIRGSDKNIIRSQSLFALALFHALVQERRTFIAQGWSKFYEFNESDLRAGADVLEQMFKTARGKDIQWIYVHGLFENVIYGGRVDNIYDQRVLSTYLQEYFNDSVLSGSSPTRKSIGPCVKIPSSFEIQDYINVVESISDYDKPSSFGLPSNIERSWQRITSGQVISQLKILSRSFDDKVKFDRTIWHTELTPLLNLWKKLNQSQGSNALLQKKLLPPTLSSKDNADPIVEFVKLEHFTVIGFMQLVHRHLGAISKVIRGVMVPSAETVSVADSLLRHETPAEWIKKWEGPTDPTIYLQGVVTRGIAISKWLQTSESKNILNDPLDLSELMNPDTFLSAFKQYCTRKLNSSMDEMKFVCWWDSRSSSASTKYTCKLTGLLLEGCSFNGVKLVESSAESQPIVKTPDCTIAWIKASAGENRQKNDLLSIPLYYNETREKLIGSLDVPCVSGESSKWIQAGVALFLKT